MSIIDIDEHIKSDIDVILNNLTNKDTFEESLNYLYNTLTPCNINTYNKGLYYIAIYNDFKHITFYSGGECIDIGYHSPVSIDYFDIHIYPYRSLYMEYMTYKDIYPHISYVYMIDESIFEKIKQNINANVK